MASVRRANVSSAVIGGVRLNFLQGQVTCRTSDAGLDSWKVFGVLGGDIDLRLTAFLSQGVPLDAEFETDRGRLSGQAFVSNFMPSSSRGITLSRVEFAVTGQLEGWAAK